MFSRKTNTLAKKAVIVNDRTPLTRLKLDFKGSALPYSTTPSAPPSTTTTPLALAAQGPQSSTGGVLCGAELVGRSKSSLRQQGMGSERGGLLGPSGGSEWVAEKTITTTTTSRTITTGGCRGDREG